MTEIEALAAHYGPQHPAGPTDPYLFLVWWHCGYPASDAVCAKGWESLRVLIGVDPESLRTAEPAQLALALKPGGMFPQLRAMRLKEIADRVQREFGGDLTAALKRLPLSKARAALKQFHGIADPGADRILLFGGISPVPAVPSNCPHVLIRLRRGRDLENYGRNYKAAQEIISAEVPANFDARMRAYLLLKCHGQQLCRASRPKCDICPAAPFCAFAKRSSAIKSI